MRPTLLRRPATPIGWAWVAARAAVTAAVVVRVARAARRQPPVRPQPHGAAPAPVTVVIPARDEANRIGRCLEALRADAAVHEVVVVDDESTDGTAAVAASLGARVVPGSPLPPGWAGKPWALQQGIEAATGAWVVTLDADTVPRPGLVAALVERCEHDGLDLLTAGARVECGTPAQQALHPAMLTTLVYRFGPAGAAHVPRPDRLLANGQVQCFRRAPLLAAGGLAAVRDDLTEDVALARHLARQGWRVAFLDATEALDVRMYESAAEAWRGWGRSLPLVDVTSPAWQAADQAVVWLALALPLPRLLVGRGDVLDAVLLAVRLGTLAGTRRAYAHPGPAYWLSPLLDLPVAARLTQAAIRPERTWRGRTYAPPAGTAPR